MPIRVLLVDDSTEMLETLSIQYRLFPHVHEIYTARNADEALKLLNSLHFDIVSLDIQLGADDGLDVCARLHERFPTLFIVMCSLEASDYNCTKAKELGASFFLSKPFGYDDLHEMFDAYRAQDGAPDAKQANQTESLGDLMESILSRLSEEK